MPPRRQQGPDKTDCLFRGSAILLGLLLAVYGGSHALAGHDEFPQQAPLSVSRSLDELREALRKDPASPFRWCELAEALVEAGEPEKARPLVGQAVKLGSNIPAIWMCAADFHFRLDEFEDAFRCSARVMRSVPDYDAYIFGYYDQVLPQLNKILAAMADHGRSLQAYFRHLLSKGKTGGAEQAWSLLVQKAYTTDLLAAQYIDLLLGMGQYGKATEAWAVQAGERREDYLRPNRLFNGGFEFEGSGVALDWRVRAVEGVEVERDRSSVQEGSYSLRIRFGGKQNVDYRHVAQTAHVSPGFYRLRAYVRTEEVTTDQGVRFSIHDSESPSQLQVVTEQLTGTNDWTPLEAVFQTPAATNLVTIQIARNASRKFDSKVSGTVWVDAVSLVPLKQGN